MVAIVWESPLRRDGNRRNAAEPPTWIRPATRQWAAPVSGAAHGRKLLFLVRRQAEPRTGLVALPLPERRLGGRVRVADLLVNVERDLRPVGDDSDELVGGVRGVTRHDLPTPDLLRRRAGQRVALDAVADLGVHGVRLAVVVDEVPDATAQRDQQHADADQDADDLSRAALLLRRRRHARRAIRRPLLPAGLAGRRRCRRLAALRVVRVSALLVVRVIAAATTVRLARVGGVRHCEFLPGNGETRAP